MHLFILIAVRSFLTANKNYRIEKEKAEIERRRSMTDEERMMEDMEEARKNPAAEKSKYKYLQKYYHKGAFYQEYDKDGRLKDQIFERDYNLPTLEDNIDKSILPKVMQVKKFGLKGRTKYTHLKDQDTSENGLWNSSTTKKDQKKLSTKNLAPSEPKK